MGKLAGIDSRLAQTLNGTWDKGHRTGTERVVGRGTRDGNRMGRGAWDAGRSKNERARLLPSQKRRRIANSEWRMVKRQIFWRAVLPHCRKFSAHQEMCPPALPKIFSAHQEMRPPIFSACFRRLRFGRHRLKTGRGTRDEGRRQKWEGEAPAEPKRQRFANSDWRMVKRQIFWRAVLLHCRKIRLTIALRTFCSPLHACTLTRLHACTHIG
jgi:hypothetical protein